MSAAARADLTQLPAVLVNYPNRISRVFYTFQINDDLIALNLRRYSGHVDRFEVRPRKVPDRLSFAVDRRLEGESVAGFPPLDIPPDDERCFLFSDLVRAGTMTEGQFQYAVRVLDQKEEIASGFRSFIAVAPEPPAAEPPPADM